MLFERLLISCLLPGVTVYSENKTCVKIEPQEGETILFFGIDRDSKGHKKCKECHLKNELKINKQGQTICDLLVFYAKDAKRVLCFVELKDNKNDFHHATEQVLNTYDALKSQTNLLPRYTIQAFLIGDHGASPMQADDDKRKLKNVFKDKYLYDGKVNEFAEFIRTGTIPFHHKSKKKTN